MRRQLQRARKAIHKSTEVVASSSLALRGPVALGTTGDCSDLGSKLKRLRSERNLTLEELGQRSGVSRSALSKIENGQVSPTYDVLQRISRGLNIDLVELFETRNHSAPIGRRNVTRASMGAPHLTSTYSLELLATELTRKKLLPFKARILARSIEEFDGWVCHEGEEFLLVLSGRVQVFTEHYSPVVLDPGDSIYFDSEMGHACVSVSKDPADVVWVCTGVMPPEGKSSQHPSKQDTAE